jgi:hypothetical protein
MEVFRQGMRVNWQAENAEPAHCDSSRNPRHPGVLPAAVHDDLPAVGGAASTPKASQAGSK